VVAHRMRAEKKYHKKGRFFLEFGTAFGKH
jgi:hypothetical protein